MQIHPEPSQATGSGKLQTRPFLISGPCSAETESQVMIMAEKLAASGRVNLFRAGIWKPRTKPGMFEGIGEPGLEWLSNAKLTYQLPITVEVATPQHVELALQYGVDVIWLGARTTVNPFYVQELAEALKGVKIPVLIKNPVNPELPLWVGALERIEKSNVGEIGLIHRGFSSYSVMKYRNAPMWQIPLEMKRRYPQLPMICDPSHICGNRTFLKEVSQKSIDLDFSGLMIESHPDPDNAWSDAQQQLTPEALLEMLNVLQWRDSSASVDQVSHELIHIREAIDHTDDELIELLAERMKLSDKIGMIKKEKNITILQTERWNDILERLLRKSLDLGLSEEFVRKYFEAVHLESINRQNTVFNEK